MKQRRIISVLAIAPLALGLAACSSSGGDDAPDTLALWDGFTQYDADSPFGRLIATCEDETGITIERTSDAAVADNLLQAASAGTTPDLVILDNPIIAQFAETGLLVANSASGLDTSSQRENVLAAAQLDGETYGGSIGSNTLALFYNEELLAAAGVEPPTDWEELRSAVTATTAGDVYGIAFSAVNTEEGSFQFEPFLWGAGAELSDLASPQAQEALQLWTDWVASGEASQSSLNANQQDVRDQFLAGNAAFMVNGTWQLAALDEAGIGYGVVPLPAIDGGPAPSPLGGEFIEIVASDDAREATSAEFAQCFVDPANLGEWAAGQSYILPDEAAAAEQAAADPALLPWVEAVSVAQGRTADLGADYPDVSRALWTAIQEAVSGERTPAEALESAQESLG
jgi:multiple sugar transport system substrate-binding protein